MQKFDVAIVGAGAAGLFCAGLAGQGGLSVLLVDHSPKLAEKIRISGGGRANFTNRDLDPRAPHRHFVSDNPHFCRSALNRYTPTHFMALLDRHGVSYHEKHKGQMFCDRSAQDLIELLVAECDAGGVTRWQPCPVQSIGCTSGGFELETAQGAVRAARVVIATGGLSIPAIGASDFGLRLAQQFGLRVVAPSPGLVPLLMNGPQWAPYAGLAGLSVPVRVSAGEGAARIGFDEDLLFTHRGLSGPAALQISSYWREGETLQVDLIAGTALASDLLRAKQSSRRRLVNELAPVLPSRLAEAWVAGHAQWDRPINEASDRALQALEQSLRAWRIQPSGTEGYKKAEVMVGGVDTRDLSSQTMESRQPGLYFIGEVVDVTGWLGGYNFQWAWASANACAQALVAAQGGPPSA